MEIKKLSDVAVKHGSYKWLWLLVAAIGLAVGLGVAAGMQNLDLSKGFKAFYAISVGGILCLSLTFFVFIDMNSSGSYQHDLMSNRVSIHDIKKGSLLQKGTKSLKKLDKNKIEVDEEDEWLKQMEVSYKIAKRPGAGSSAFYALAILCICQPALGKCVADRDPPCTSVVRCSGNVRICTSNGFDQVCMNTGDGYSSVASSDHSYWQWGSDNDQRAFYNKMECDLSNSNINPINLYAFLSLFGYVLLFCLGLWVSKLLLASWKSLVMGSTKNDLESLQYDKEGNLLKKWVRRDDESSRKRLIVYAPFVGINTATLIFLVVQLCRLSLVTANEIEGLKYNMLLVGYTGYDPDYNKIFKLSQQQINLAYRKTLTTKTDNATEKTDYVLNVYKDLRGVVPDNRCKLLIYHQLLKNRCYLTKAGNKTILIYDPTKAARQWLKWGRTGTVGRFRNVLPYNPARLGREPMSYISYEKNDCTKTMMCRGDFCRLGCGPLPRESMEFFTITYPPGWMVTSVRGYSWIASLVGSGPVTFDQFSYNGGPLEDMDCGKYSKPDTTRGATEVTCIPHTNNELTWYSTNLDNTMNVEQEWGGVKPSRSFVKNSLQIRLLYERWDQDNVQEAAIRRYFIFSFVAYIEDATNEDIEDLQNDFPSCGSNQATNFCTTEITITGTEHASFTSADDCPARAGNPVVTYANGDYSAIIKGQTNIYDQDSCLKPFSMVKSTFKPLSAGSTPEKNNYMASIYYSIGIKGTATADVNLWGEHIVKIQTIVGACPLQVPTVRYGGACFIRDWTASSINFLVSGMPDLGTVAAPYDPTSRWPWQKNHPKLGKGTYLSQVAATFTIGKFSTTGLCSDIEKDPETNTELCASDGLPVVESDIITEGTPYVDLPEAVLCREDSDVMHCAALADTKITVCRTELPLSDSKKAKCETVITSSLTIIPEKETSYWVKGGPSVEQFSMSVHKVEEFGNEIDEVFIRDNVGMSIFAVTLLALSGILALCLLFLILAFCNSYTIGIMMRKVGLTSWTRTKSETQCCKGCGSRLYYEFEPELHVEAESRNMCPYCLICNNEMTEVCSMLFKNKKDLQKHIRYHKWYRRNPVVGRIMLNFSTISIKSILLVVIAIALLPSLKAFECNQEDNVCNDDMSERTFQKRTRGRGDLEPYEIDSTVTESSCDDNSLCSIKVTLAGTVPIFNRASFKTTLKIPGYTDKVVTYEIRNPSTKLVCETKYMSANIAFYKTATNYACRGSESCSEGQDVLYTPIGSTSCDDPGWESFITASIDNPLLDYYCPKSLSCVSPWRPRCATINQGVGVGYVSVMPDIEDWIATVAECQYVSRDFDICSLNAQSNIENCWSTSLTEGTFETQTGFIHFNWADPTSIQTRFNIAAISKLGDAKPTLLVADVPGLLEAAELSPLALQMKYVPLTQTCLAGTTYHSIQTSLTVGARRRPQIEYRDNKVKLSPDTISNSYRLLNNVIQCNLENTFLNWTDHVETRNLDICDRHYSDSPDSKVASIGLSAELCDFGPADYIANILINETLTKDYAEIIGLSSGICEGSYNRDRQARVCANIELSKPGMLTAECDNLNCASHTCNGIAKTLSFEACCNLTILLPGKVGIRLNGKIYDFDCSQLVFQSPDNPSNYIHGGTGSATSAYNPNKTWSLWRRPIGKFVIILCLAVALIILIIIVKFLLGLCITSSTYDKLLQNKMKAD